MEALKNDGDTEEIPALPGKDIKTLEGVFFKPVGKKLTINFQNDTGKRFTWHIYIMSYYTLQIGPVT